MLNFTATDQSPGVNHASMETYKMHSCFFSKARMSEKSEKLKKKTTLDVKVF